VKLTGPVYAAGFVGALSRWLVPFVLLLTLAAAPGRAHAAEPQVSVNVDPCVPVNHAQLERLLAIELGTSTGQGGAAPAPTHVWVVCTEQGIELRLQDAVTRKSMTRSLPASSFTNAESTRLLALAVAEFVVASWIELRVQPEHVVEPLGPPPTPAARRTAEHAVARRAVATSGPPYDNSLSGAFTIQVWSSNDSVLLGGGLRSWQMIAGPLAWAAYGDINTGSVQVPFGTVSITTASVALALALRVRFDALAFYTGPGARIGYVHLAGSSDDPSRVEGKRFSAAHGGGLWLARVEFWGGERLRIGLDVEAGLTTLPVEGVSATKEIALNGLWLTTGLSVGFGF
jgi:hypothetical protein